MSRDDAKSDLTHALAVLLEQLVLKEAWSLPVQAVVIAANDRIMAARVVLTESETDWQFLGEIGDGAAMRLPIHIVFCAEDGKAAHFVMDSKDDARRIH